jgi:D-lactate dehydrogenase (cytochrome)
MDDGREIEAAERFLDRLAERALAMDGPCTGEHGVGQGKIKFLSLEHGPEAMAIMAAIKRAMDPEGMIAT